MPKKIHKPEEVVAKLRQVDVLVSQGQTTADAIRSIGVPGHVRSDNGAEFVAQAVQDWIKAVGAKTAYIAPGSPWENGYVVSFNARLTARRNAETCSQAGTTLAAERETQVTLNIVKPAGASCPRQCDVR